VGGGGGEQDEWEMRIKFWQLIWNQVAAYKWEDNVKTNMKESECVMGFMYLNKGINHDVYKTR